MFFRLLQSFHLFFTYFSLATYSDCDMSRTTAPRGMPDDDDDRDDDDRDDEENSQRNVYDVSLV